LTPTLAASFLEASAMDVQGIIDMLRRYGETNIDNGCKTRLLMQLKELLIEQSALAQDGESKNFFSVKNVNEPYRFFGK
jgi:hypothetical protein